MRTQRVPTPAWAVAEDINKMAASHQKRDEAESLRELQDLHFSDFEGNLGIQRARAGVLVSRMKPPKGWGPQHTHVTVSGFRVFVWVGDEEVAHEGDLLNIFGQEVVFRIGFSLAGCLLRPHPH